MTLFSCRKLYSAVTTYILLTLYILIFVLADVLQFTPANVLLLGRPYGGLCIMWRKPLGSFVTLKQYTERIIGIEVKGSTNLSLLNVYLPYDNNKCESLDNYMQILAEISAIIKNCSTHEMVIMGDFNADCKRRFGQELRTLCK